MSNEDKKRSYKTYQYLKYTFGLIRPHDTSFEVEENDSGRKLNIRKTFGKNQSMALNDPNVTVDQGTYGFKLLRKMFDAGNIKVQGANGETLLKRVQPVSAFKAALLGDHPDLEKPLPPEPPAPPPLPWHEGLTDDDLEDFAVILPAISYDVFSALYDYEFMIPLYDRHLADWNTPKEGWLRTDKGSVLKEYWVSKGTVTHDIGKMNSDNRLKIVAPFDGKVIPVSSRVTEASWDLEAHWPERQNPDGGLKNHLESTSYGLIRPLKNRYNEHALKDAYADLFSRLEKVLAQAKKGKTSGRCHEGHLPSLIEGLESYINHMPYSKNKILPREQLEEYRRLRVAPLYEQKNDAPDAPSL